MSETETARTTGASRRGRPKAALGGLLLAIVATPGPASERPIDEPPLTAPRQAESPEGSGSPLVWRPIVRVESESSTAESSTAASSEPLSTAVPAAANATPDFGEWSRMLTLLAREHLPHTFRDDKHWGGTTRRWDGVDVERDGLRIETRRRWKEVNHGTWKRYEVALVDPAREFTVTLKRFERRPDGRLAIDFDIESDVRVHGQIARWNRGVQLVALSADATARLRLTIGLSLGTGLDLSELPPAVVFDPHVHAARLELVEFELDRVGQIAGELAELMGAGAEGVLEEKVRDQEGKLVEKLNRAIDKRRPKLRLSLTDLAKSDWGRRIERYLAASRE